MEENRVLLRMEENRVLRAQLKGGPFG